MRKQNKKVNAMPIKMKPLKIATYNIRHGADAGFDFSVLAEDLFALDVDIAGIQEIDICTERVGGVDSLRALCEKSPYKYFRFIHAMNYRGGEYGTAIISRYPINEFGVFPLTSDRYEPRAAGLAIIDIDGEPLCFFNTHLEYKSAHQRAIQFAQLASILNSSERYILTGDFNTENFSEFDVIKDKRLANNDAERFETFPLPVTETREKGGKNGMAIDNIVISDTLGFLSKEMVNTHHSDHCILAATVGILPEGAEK